MKKRAYIDIDSINTVSECLVQLANAEQAQVDIAMQLAQHNSNENWRRKAEAAQKTVRYKRRLITSRLAVLRQIEKEDNIRLHQQHNDYLVDELKLIVTPSSFERCNRRAMEKMEANCE